MTATAAPLALDTIVFARGLATLPAAGPVLAGIDLDILPGEIFTIVGRSGAGKSALLEALVGLRPVVAEQFVVCGTDPRRFPAAVKQRIGVAPRRAALDRKIRVGEALTLFAQLYDRADPDATLRQLELEPIRHRQVDSLPPDLAQRVSLALALLNDPAVLFADEPTRDLDAEAARLVWRILRERRERGRTSVITTNHLEAAAGVSDRVAVIHGGRLLAADTPAALVARSTAPVRVSIELVKPELPLAAIRALDGVIEVHLDRSEYVMTSNDGVATLRAALRLLESLGIRPVATEMRQQTLEDVVLQLTHAA